MKILTYGKVIVALLTISGCTSMGGTKTKDVDASTTNKIALCSGGLSSGIAAKVNANVADLLKEGNGAITAGIEDKLQGIIFGLGGLTENKKTEIYDMYLKCLKEQFPAK